MPLEFINLHRVKQKSFTIHNPCQKVGLDAKRVSKSQIFDGSIYDICIDIVLPEQNESAFFAYGYICDVCVGQVAFMTLHYLVESAMYI